jgi:hypothetical protein
METLNMQRIWSYLLCTILISYNILYICLVLSQIDFVDDFGVRVLDIPGLVFGFIGFPLMNILLWINSAKIKWVDYSLIFMLPLLWLLIVPGGSFANFIFINPAMIGIVSSLYFFRFSFGKKQTKDDSSLWKKALFLWVVITGILIFLSILVPVLPE